MCSHRLGEELDRDRSVVNVFLASFRGSKKGLFRTERPVVPRRLPPVRADNGLFLVVVRMVYGRTLGHIQHNPKICYKL